ncbi:DNA-binding Lrp family transcriptional regulator [Kitasatospora gansuensis]|uniref:DNA-binding Lrp family transcriptional regulator n=1 Tax=Kitasatospora gansuensis TaxID=258050 RepID=A0A7W7S8H3_9ACTN|nr:Lrp/AsnC family transcriptional regulator [Kitasatospora gansuensis]MBB4945876.1 DNA-binding Lrp family transcriptional regulator [Kitasatospora gansuensis]
MDRIDRRILHELQRDGRLTNAELAARVDLTPSPCLRRVRQLEQDGVILGYRALLDGAALDRGFQPFVTIVMRHEDKATVADFERQVAALPEVVEAHRLFGDPDYLLRIAVADIAAYERFITDVLSGLPGIAQVNSHLTMKRVKADQGLPTGADRSR